MHELMKKTTPLLAWYFIGFYLLGAITFLNLLTALTIDFYRLQYSDQNQKDLEKTIKIPHNDEVEGAKIVNVLHVWFEPQTNWRQQLAGVADLTEISEDTILSCQKYTKVNLTETIKKRNSHHSKTHETPKDEPTLIPFKKSETAKSETGASPASTESTASKLSENAASTVSSISRKLSAASAGKTLESSPNPAADGASHTGSPDQKPTPSADAS